MTLVVHTAGELRRAVGFTDLIGPLSAAFQDYSRGRAAADNGNTRRAKRAARLSKDNLTELGEILGGSYRRDPSQITVASLVGIGVQDVVAAEVALAVLAAR
jgi:ornithine cyclodeaminase/alanine dehydrogenase-like protein (mu-crystallin family)